MKPNYPIYIPSKGRSESSVTAKVLDAEKIDFYIVIEPQDEESYIKFWDKSKILVMNENNMGMAYVRRWIKAHSTAQKSPYHWQMDDNIKSFKQRIDGKNIPMTALKGILEIENFVTKYKNIGQAGFRHVMYAWTQKTEFSLNQQCPSAIIVNNELPITWRDGVVEDTDFSLQILSLGYCTILFNRLVMEKMATMTLGGGCTDMYYKKEGVRFQRQKRLMQLWPGVFKSKVINGVTRISPSQVWRKFPQVPLLK
jgi:hypothetical protein